MSNKINNVTALESPSQSVATIGTMGSHTLIDKTSKCFLVHGTVLLQSGRPLKWRGHKRLTESPFKKTIAFNLIMKLKGRQFLRIFFNIP